MAIDGRLLTAFGMLGFFLCILGGALEFSGVARVGPLLTGVMGAVCTGFEVIVLLRRSPQGVVFTAVDSGRRAREVKSFAWLSMLIVVVIVAGLVVGVMFWLAAFLYWQEKRGRLYAAGTALGAGMFIYLVFDRLLAVVLFPGILATLL